MIFARCGKRPAPNVAEPVKDDACQLLTDAEIEAAQGSTCRNHAAKRRKHFDS
jgi:hypothetical protein